MMFRMVFGQKGQLVRCSQTGLHLVQATGNLNPPMKNIVIYIKLKSFMCFVKRTVTQNTLIIKVRARAFNLS